MLERALCSKPSDNPILQYCCEDDEEASGIGGPTRGKEKDKAAAASQLQQQPAPNGLHENQGGFIVEEQAEASTLHQEEEDTDFVNTGNKKFF
jgi:hypothetical protein